MNYNDKILFEKNFYYKGSKSFSSKQFKFLINIILNSKELEGMELLHFHCECLDTSGYSVKFEMYYQDKVTHENRSMLGNIIISKGETIITGKVNIYGEYTRELDIYEVIYIENNEYYRFSSYPYANYNECLGYDINNKYDSFEEKTLRKLRG